VDGQVIRISLPPGRRAELSLSTSVTPSFAGQMAVLNWASSGLPSGAADTGSIPALSPPRTISLVHAVPKPLAAPQFAEMPVAAIRNVGATTIRVRGNLTVDAATTMSVSLVGTWTEWSQGAAAFVSRSLRVGEPHKPVAGNTVAFDETLQMGTTAHVDLTLTPLATGAFAEMFPLGTDCTLSGSPVQLFSPASQAPPTPRVSYAIPTFTWSDTRPTPRQVNRKRGGNAVRLWLEPPWFTSGAGEKLAVVVGNNPTLPVSRWGADPVTRNDQNTVTPPPSGAEDFVDPAALRVNWPGDENRSAVTLALHDVQFDPTSGRYWCDVVFDASKLGIAYRPFVQLVVAAYQDRAIGPGPQVSEFVHVPPIQVFSDRELRVTLGNEAQPGISVQLVGNFLLPPSEITRSLYTTAGLSVTFDNKEIGVLEDPVIQAPSPDLPKPTTSSPAFDASMTFSVDSGGYLPTLKAGWTKFAVTVSEDELSSFSTTNFRKWKLPDGIITDTDPGPVLGVTFADFPSSPIRRNIRMVYWDKVEIENGPSGIPAA
jgi:hypothetical protein